MKSPFSAHVALLGELLNRRRSIAERIESTLLNVRGKPVVHSRSRAQFDRQLHACFFGLPGLSPALASLKGELHASHIAAGFEPIQLDRFANELDPLELIVRAYEHWEQHRWPGSAGRVAYAHTLFAVFMLRQLEALSLRIWDQGGEQAPDRLGEVQALLDRLNDPAMPGVRVRDARWLMQTAQGPFTKHLRPYFEVATRIAGSFTDAARLEIHKAGAKLAGGHLRSQLRYRVWATGHPIDHPENLAFMRNTNSMDGALLLGDLVPLLEAYATACEDTDDVYRYDLADAILQGISVDPELFLERLDLVGPCTVVEDLFLENGPDDRPRYTTLGQTHFDRVSRYRDLVATLAEPLKADSARLDPSNSAYSPLGITYGFCGDMLSNMAMDMLVANPTFGFGLEDFFSSRGHVQEKSIRAGAWARLPQRAGERPHFDHSIGNAMEHFARLVAALDARCRRPHAPNVSIHSDARLVIGSADDAAGDAVSGDDYCVATDARRVAAGTATAWPLQQILSDRQEGRYLASAESDGAWVGISKVVLTLVTAQGRDAMMTDLPEAVIARLRLTCPGLLAFDAG